MTTTQLGRYARLLLWCIGGVDGRRVFIRSEPVHRDFVVQLAETAYAEGAIQVVIDYDEPLLVRARIRSASDEGLTAHAEYESALARELAGHEWSFIRVRGSEEPDYLKGLDSRRIGVYSKAAREVMMPLSETVTRFTKHWVGALMPTRALATRACPGDDPEAALSRYDREIVRVLSLDSDDPVAVWEKQIDDLTRRRDLFDSLELDSIHLSGPGTDLEVGMIRGARWATAQAVMPDGRSVFVNMPSLEIFTSPDRSKTNGRVAATRPYLSTSSPGTLIAGAWFEFKDGAVVDFGADEGAKLLGSVLEMDANAKYLGEIALVDATSAVAEAGFTFFNTLYDENAATHMALGRGFPGFVDGTEGKSPSELIGMGVNHSLVHDDVMIGSLHVDIDGRTRSNEVVPLMRAGQFVE